MGSTTAYQCDGPTCAALTTRDAGKRAPDGWIRATIAVPGELDGRTGSFHNAECLARFVEVFLGGSGELPHDFQEVGRASA